MYKIFLVEDDRNISEQIKIFLSKFNYSIQSLLDFQNIIEEILQYQPHLLLLDITLPYYDGYYICKAIREKSQIPIVIITGKNSQLDEFLSFNIGADDFISKPFNLDILRMRISSVIKRVYDHTIEDNIIYYKDLSLNVGKNIVSFHEKQIELTKNEEKILEILMEKNGNIVSREDIANAIWQTDVFIDDNTLTININRLRKKLNSIDAVDFLITRRGQGYSL